MKGNMKNKYESGSELASKKGAGVETGLSEHYECKADNNTLDYNVESSKQKPAMEKAKGGYEFYGN